MRKLIENNINTPDYWDTVYISEIEVSRERIALDRFHRVAEMIPRNAEVLDVGCGTGDFVRYLEVHRPDCTISACDFSTVAIEHANSKSPNALFSVVDALKLTDAYPSTKKFDFVSCFETIEHVSDPQQLVDELLKVVVADGLVVVTTPYDDHVMGGDEHLNAFKFDDFLTFFETGSSFILSLYRYSENYKNMLCVAKKI